MMNNEIKIGSVRYVIIENKPYFKEFKEHEKTLYGLEFNFLHNCKILNFNEFVNIYKHSSNEYYLLYHQYKNYVYLSLFYILDDNLQSNNQNVLLSKVQIKLKEFNRERVYEELIFPYVLSYHVSKEHYKRLHLKIVNRSIRRILECRFMQGIFEYVQTTKQKLKDAHYYVLIKKDNKHMNNIEREYTEEDLLQNDDWKIYYD